MSNNEPSTSNAESDSTDAENKTVRYVAPFSRVVPNGVHFKEKLPNPYLRATIQLTPIPISTPDAWTNGIPKIELNCWPSEIVSEIENGADFSRETTNSDSEGRPAFSIKLFLRSIGAEQNNQSAIPVHAVATALQSTFSNENGQVLATHKRRKSNLDGLWASTFEHKGVNGSEAWDNFWGALKLSKSVSAFKASDEMREDIDEQTATDSSSVPKDNRNSDIAEYEMSNSGRGASSIKVDGRMKKKRVVEAIYTMEHADTALALEYARVSDLINTKYQTTHRTASLELGAEPKKTKNDDEVELEKSNLTEAVLKIKNKERRAQFKKLANNYIDGQKAFKNATDRQEKMSSPHLKGCDVLTDSVINRKTTSSLIGDRKQQAAQINNGAAVHTYSSPNMVDVEDKDGDTAPTTVDKNTRPDQGLEFAAQQFFSIQSTAVLARLYCLAIDVEIEITPELACQLGGGQWSTALDGVGTGQCEIPQSKLDGNKGYANANEFFVISTCRQEDVPECTAYPEQEQFKSPWTLTKLNIAGLMSGNTTSNRHAFWPVTWEECASDSIDDAAAASFTSQLGGYRIGGECWPSEHSGPTPRFDLTSLDIRSAIEQQLLTAQLSSDKKESDTADQQSVKETDISVVTADAESLNSVFHTAGLCILDRGIRSEKCGQLARKEHIGVFNSKEVIYANDLTIGYRLDVGVPDKTDGAPAWRPLHLREVSYGKGTGVDDDPENIADELVQELAGKMTAEGRMNMDAGMISMPEQLIPKRSQSPDKQRIEMSVAENVVTWEGAPLGVEVLDSKSINLDHTNPSASNKEVEVQDILPFGRHLSLPSSNSQRNLTRKPPPLRFGWPYCFALRAVYSGGKSVDIDAQNSMGSAVADKLRFPGVCDSESNYKPSYFRFLRQKSIDAPVTLMPLAEALKSHDAMGYQENSRMIVRSIEPRGVEEIEKELHRATPESTYRVILPPALAMDDVARHGVLDNQSDSETPEGAFRGLAWRKSGNGARFPLFKVKSVLGYNGAWLPTEERKLSNLVYDQTAIGTADDNTYNSRIRTGYNTPVYRRLRADTQDPYYPDPFAQKLVFSVRYSGTDTLVRSKNYEVDVYRDGHSDTARPDPRKARAVVLKCKKKVKTRGKEADTELFTKKFVDLTADGSITTASSNRAANAIEVTLEIPAGLSYEVSFWFLPSERMLARKSALVQALAVRSMLAASDNNIQEKLYELLRESSNTDPALECLSSVERFDLLREVCLDGLDKVGLADTSEKKHSSAELINRNYLLSAPGGLPVPTDDVLLDVARRFLKKASQNALPEVGASGTIMCTHASNVVDSPPTIANFMFHRLQPDRFTEACEQSRTPIIVEDESTAMISGEALVDLNQVSGFDIVVTTENASTANFDDKFRRRDLAAFRSGDWPTERDIENNAYIKTTGQLFGFEVNTDGLVDLPKHEVTLFSVRNLPPTASITVPKATETAGRSIVGFDELTGLTTIKLVPLLYNELVHDLYGKEALHAYLNGVQVTAHHSFSDCIGRNISLKLVTIPRSMHLLSTAETLQNRIHQVSVPFPHPRDYVVETQMNHLPPSVRPAQPAARGPLYCFDWSSKTADRIKSKAQNRFGGDVLIRKPVIRLTLDRSWFSADANEKVGIVLWPPNLKNQPFLYADPDKNTVRYEPAWNSDYCRDIELHQFQDDDLGVGGQYTTRLGADPIKHEQRSLRTFLEYRSFVPDKFSVSHLGAFTETWSDEYEQHCIVENALMPVSGLEEHVEGSENTVQFMSVGLLLYTPRFDPETETWFIDVALNDRATVFSEPFIRFGLVRYCENAREDLQVSQPAVVWAKIMPDRHVEYALTNINETENRYALRVSVNGAHASTGLNSEYSGLTKIEKPSMQLIVARERKEFGVVQREFVSNGVPKSDVRKSGPELRKVRNDRDEYWIKMNYVARGEFAGHWEATIDVELTSPLQSDESLVMYVEEVEHYRPATYPNEPVEADIFSLEASAALASQDFLVETGPRFACRAVLKSSLAVIKKHDSIAVESCD